MKKVKCSGCLQVLGVPTKFFGKKITCPNCNLRLMISIDTPSAEEDELNDDRDSGATESIDDPAKPTLPPAAPPKFGKITTLRAIPRPSSLGKNEESREPVADFATKAGEIAESVPSSASSPTEIPQASIASPKVVAPNNPTAKSQTKSKPSNTKPNSQKRNAGPVETRSTSRSVSEQPSKTGARPDTKTATHQRTQANEPAKAAQPVTARIIQASEVKPDFNDEGELPTLQLKDDKKVAPKTKDSGTSPVLLGALVCGSLVLSGLIFVFGDFRPKVDERAMQKARQELAKFYSVRIDIPLKPYQIRLREAQLAHSRGDRESEVSALRDVMKQFRAEDRNKFVGVTGSPTADAELENLVSILLGNGRSERKGLFR